MCVCVKVFLDETGIWITGPSKVNCPPQCGWTSCNPLRVWIEQEEEEGETAPSCFVPAYWSWDISSHLLPPSDHDLYHQLPLFSVLCTQTELYHCHSSVSSLQIMGLLSLHHSYWFCFSEEPRLINFLSSGLWCISSFSSLVFIDWSLQSVPCLDPTFEQKKIFTSI